MTTTSPRTLITLLSRALERTPRHPGGEVPAAGDAPPYDRLAAFVGRHPAGARATRATGAREALTLSQGMTHYVATNLATKEAP
ncbi:hypothetical protein PS9374_02851 [Planomonospora sphaerica]|uniref:Uncharacterized protein n=1 Tax=Planomonospora sphaerica TaxID=161355 RepID=A0A171CTM0_9ACTN|nr:hypothetical protein [Planomonospora sphaerica]GAT67198.1 hypothetical protein PS9374_02851 [Planomonospora sphaerica]